MKKLSWFLISIVVIILDQYTKYLAASTLLYHEAKHILPILNFTLAYNTGSAFGFLHNAGAWHQWFFLIFGGSAAVFLCIYIFRTRDVLTLLGLNLILGGDLGNIIDRLHQSYVLDFIQVFYQGNFFPVFNLADAAISLGAMLLLCSQRKSNHEDA
jgi:signal peptidase II